MNIKKLRGYIISFILPAVLLLIVFALLEIYPFGGKDLLWFDTQGQYIDFLAYWQDVIKGEASIFYSFSKTIGGNMYGLFTYYLTSPINLIVMFFSKINLPSAFMLIILLKIGLCGTCFYHYLNKTKFIETRTKHPEVKKIIFSSMYAMTSYNIVYSMSHMWLDCVALLPLIFLGLEKIIYERKWGLYLASFTMAIIANYYIAFMIAVFTIPYFCYILFCHNKEKKFKTIIKENKDSIWQYIRMSLIAALISGIIIIPTIYSLLGSKGQLFSSTLQPLDTSFNYLTLFAKNTLGASSMNELIMGAPNIYSGLITLILTVMYFLNKSIDKKEKIYTGMFILLLFLCFYFDPINLFLHMLQSPMSFPFRYSFIFSFITLILSYKCINNMEKINLKNIVAICMGLIIIFLLVAHNKYEYLTNTKVLITIIFVVIYSAYMLKITKLGKLGHISLVILICAELIINGYLAMSWMPYGDRNNYLNHLNQYMDVYNYIKETDEGLYRISYSSRKSANDSLMYNFAGVEHNSSVGEKSTEGFLSKLGYSRLQMVEYGQGTILDNSLLGVKYILAAKATDYYTFKEAINYVPIYENPYALSFGYISSDKILEYDKQYESSNPFEYQNYIFGLITGEEEKYFAEANYEITEYNNLNIKDNNDTYNISLIDQTNFGYIDITIKDLNKPIYSYLSQEVRSGMVSFTVNEQKIQIGTSNISYIGFSEEEIKLRIEVYDEVNLNKKFLNYLDTEKVLKKIQELKEKNLEIKEHKDNYIKGKITVEKDEILFTTIPYDKGWTVKINGNKVEPEKVLDTFMALNLSDGENVIELKYKSPGVTSGLLITIIGVIILGFELFLKKKQIIQTKQIEEKKIKEPEKVKKQ